MRALAHLIKDSGGLGYHLRAWRFRDLWQNHIDNTQRWLNLWKPATSNGLILVGPSGGYSLPRAFLAQFPHIEAYDPDPLARYFFQKNHPNIHVHWHLESFHWQSDSAAAILFCNVLGQQRGLSIAEREAMRAKLSQLVKTTSVASYHDLWSTSGRVDNTTMREVAHQENAVAESIQFYKSSIRSQQVVDHLTSELFAPTGQRSQWLWQITSNYFHCIEGVRFSKQDKGA